MNVEDILGDIYMLGKSGNIKGNYLHFLCQQSIYSFLDPFPVTSTFEVDGHAAPFDNFTLYRTVSTLIILTP